MIRFAPSEIVSTKNKSYVDFTLNAIFVSEKANPLLIAFSARNNWKKLFHDDSDYKRSDSDFIHCMDGIRVVIIETIDYFIDLFVFFLILKFFSIFCSEKKNQISTAFVVLIHSGRESWIITPHVKLLFRLNGKTGDNK